MLSSGRLEAIFIEVKPRGVEYLPLRKLHVRRIRPEILAGHDAQWCAHGCRFSAKGGYDLYNPILTFRIEHDFDSFALLLRRRKAVANRPCSWES